MTISYLRHFAVISVLLLISACSMLPENLKSEDPQLITSYSAWKAVQSSASHVRLGGVIAKVTNLKNKTRVEVVNLPINCAGKPDINQEPQGRFVGYIDGFVEPVSFAKGRLITMLGQSRSQEIGKIGQHQYTFPVMQVEGFHLWRIEEKIIIHKDLDNHLYRCRGFYCRDLHHSSRHGKIIQEVE